LLIKRPNIFWVIVPRLTGNLGIDLYFDNDKSPGVLITSIGEGHIHDWNVKHPDLTVQLMDRIIAVNGVEGTAAQLLKHMQKDGGERLELLMLRAASDCPSSGPVDVSSLTKMSVNDLGLLPQPDPPLARTALVQVFVRSQEFGGYDKSASGHRYDTIPIANGFIATGLSCQLIHYVHEQHDIFFEVCTGFDAVIVRCSPGQIEADGGEQCRFDHGLRGLRRQGILVWPAPDVTEKICAKDSPVKISNLNVGLGDTLAYHTAEALSEGFRRTMAFQPRLLKQNGGDTEDGIWIVQLKSGNYCVNYGDRSCEDDEVLILVEACDGHEEQHTVAEFVEFCVNGRTEKAGEWTSRSAGRYLDGSQTVVGQLVDQRFCPRIVEGELRLSMIGNTCTGITHRQAKGGGTSADAPGFSYTFYSPSDPRFSKLRSEFQEDLSTLMYTLGVPEEPLPLWWTADFILASPPNLAPSEARWIASEFNCACPEIDECIAAYCTPETPEACYSDVTAENRAAAKRLGDLMGATALDTLQKLSGTALPVANEKEQT